MGLVLIGSRDLKVKSAPCHYTYQSWVGLEAHKKVELRARRNRMQSNGRWLEENEGPIIQSCKVFAARLRGAI